MIYLSFMFQGQNILRGCNVIHLGEYNKGYLQRYPRGLSDKIGTQKGINYVICS